MYEIGSQPLSVAALLDILKVSLDRNFGFVSVVGEVIDPFVSSKGHMYLSLRDAQAELKVVMYRREVQRQRRLPKAGDRVMARGSITIFSPRGDLQLQAISLALDGLGEQIIALAELKARLQAEGIFDRPKREPPLFAKRLGVVTSLGSAVIHDIVQCVRRRNPAVQIWLAPAAVSGPQCSRQIMDGLDRLSGRVDLVIVARGGGSFEELLPFSDELLIRKVVSYPLPVISAIGHGSDITLLDLVADACAPTPTAAAELATTERAELLREHQLLRQRLKHLLTLRLGSERQELRHLARFCQSLNPALVAKEARITLVRLQKDLCTNTFKTIKGCRSAAIVLNDRMRRIPWLLRLQEQRQAVKALEGRLVQRMLKILAEKRESMAILRLGCVQLGPLSALERGFALVFVGVKPIDSVKGRSEGEELELVFADGAMRVRVSSVVERPLAKSRAYLRPRPFSEDHER